MNRSKYSLAHHPEVDFKYYLDLQVNMAANDPAFDGLTSSGPLTWPSTRSRRSTAEASGSTSWSANAIRTTRPSRRGSASAKSSSGTSPSLPDISPK